MFYKISALLGAAALVAGVENTSAHGRGLCTAEDGCRDNEDATLLQTLRQEVSQSSRSGKPAPDAAPTQADGIVACEGSKIGTCNCVVMPGFKTYSFADSVGTQRCFTVYAPPDVPKPLPVIFLLEYNFAQMQSLMVPRMQFRLGPRGIASVFVGSNEGSFVKNHKLRNQITKVQPQVCTSPDVELGRNILTTLESQSDTFDMTRVYVDGFSENGLLGAALAFCFSHKIRGLLLGGSPIIVPAALAGVYSPDAGLGFVVKEYARFDTCLDACLAWPILPCYEPSHPLLVCLASTNNDPYVWDKSLTHSMNEASYQLLKDEGHVVTKIVWNNGQGHSKQVLWNEWLLSCLQVLPPCPTSCWDASKLRLTCNNCTMTAEMLQSAVPYATMVGTPGSFVSPGGDSSHTRPASSICEHSLP